MKPAEKQTANTDCFVCVTYPQKQPHPKKRPEALFVFVSHIVVIVTLDSINKPLPQIERLIDVIQELKRLQV